MPHPRDEQRLTRLRHGMREAGIDVLLCSLPANVLLLSGYWPVVGTSLALLSSEGELTLLVPEDECDLANHGWADHVDVITGDGLTQLSPAADHVEAALAGAALRLRASGKITLGRDGNGGYEPSTYASSFRYGTALDAVAAAAFPRANILNADGMLRSQRAVLTPFELERVAAACSVAATAFEEGASQLVPGITEIAVASQFRTPLETEALHRQPSSRAMGFAWCMAGAHSAEAGGAYARSRGTPVLEGEFALVHCNSCVDGYWTDITRTFALGEVYEEQSRMYDAVFAARDAALHVVRPGISGADVDAAARGVLRDRGYGDAFTHGLGHGVGFAAIDHNAVPRLHPASNDRLEVGMVCNIEPAIYLSGRYGMRHCDMIHITEHGARLLTPFLGTQTALTAGTARRESLA